MMNKWIIDPGFPYLNLTKLNSKDNKYHYKVVQQRYFKSDSNSS